MDTPTVLNKLSSYSLIYLLGKKKTAMSCFVLLDACKFFFATIIKKAKQQDRVM